MGSAIHFPGLADRIGERLRALGYVKGDRLDVTRFCLERGYLTPYLYQWLKGATPTYPYLERLAKDLGCELGWLLLGDPRFSPDRPPRGARRRRRPVPIAGGSGPAEGPPLDLWATVLPLIRHWRDALRRWVMWPTSDGWGWASA